MQSSPFKPSSRHVSAYSDHNGPYTHEEWAGRTRFNSFHNAHFYPLSYTISSRLVVSVSRILVVFPIRVVSQYATLSPSLIPHQNRTRSIVYLWSLGYAPPLPHSSSPCVFVHSLPALTYPRTTRSPLPSLPAHVVRRVRLLLCHLTFAFDALCSPHTSLPVLFHISLTSLSLPRSSLASALGCA